MKKMTNIFKTANYLFSELVRANEIVLKSKGLIK